MSLKKCPYCPSMVKDLKGHLARMHPDKVEPENNTGDENTKIEGENLTLDTGDNKTRTETTTTTYRCVDCGYAGLTYGQLTCPECDTQLDWEGL